MAVSLAASPAEAALQLCNQTSYVLYAAVGIQESAKILTRGWTRVFPGDCANAIAEPLKGSAYFIYARSAHAQGASPRVWGGQFQFCAQDQSFSLETRASTSGCNMPGAFAAPFAPVATNGAASWTMTFTESATIASPDDARTAGIRRLLSDLGYNPGESSKNMNDALALFRRKEHLPQTAAPDQVFAALENDEKKASAPQGGASQGYSICNDGDSDIWAAVGLKAGQDFVSRGWWQVAAGGCALAIGSALNHDAVYLYASKHGNGHLVSGPMNFCISETQFDIHGRDRCKERGMAVAGFAATNAKGSPGFTARIGNGGLAAH
ncbi:MAG TPA: DUF1036 domain-containing protein [Rhizomicrobium sp.]|nr:DUF1036 domain-containing protein [Rhizomicrobium sp.]